MLHPFQAIPAEKYVWFFLPLLVLTLLLTGVLFAIPLQPDILQFEFHASDVIASWNELDKRWAAFSLGLDFLYLVVYSTTISLACVWIAKGWRTRELPFWSAGIWLAWLQWLAAFLDAVENISLLIILFGDRMNTLPQIARWCAISKFSLIALGLVYIMGSGIVLVVTQTGRKNAV